MDFWDPESLIRLCMLKPSIASFLAINETYHCSPKTFWLVHFPLSAEEYGGRMVRDWKCSKSGQVAWALVCRGRRFSDTSGAFDEARRTD